jgi:hypothetical protein
LRQTQFAGLARTPAAGSRLVWHAETAGGLR